jgi:hypothetical protein
VFNAFDDDSVYLEGDPGLRMLSGSQIVVDPRGFASGNATFEVWHTHSRELPDQGSEHPMRRGIRCESYTDTFVDGGFIQRHCNYVGVDVDRLRDGQTEFVYRLRRGTSQEDIRTHPRFRSIAGTPNNPRNGAVFVDQNGNPVLPRSFRLSDGDNDGAGAVLKVVKRGGVLHPDDGEDNLEEIQRGHVVATFDRFVGSRLSGVTSYRSANSTVWEEMWTSIYPPEEYNAIVGKIATPRGPYPQYGGGHNWLYDGLDYEVRGTWSFQELADGKSKTSFKHIYTCSRIWVLSGPRGWEPIIYA